MEIINTKIDGVYIIKPKVFTDTRGEFLKPFNKDIFKEHGLVSNFKENFYSISHKNVIRGMHFQRPPNDHAKLVYVPEGKIMDVVLDLRKESVTYGEFVSVELSSENRWSIYIPRGCAHGFISLKDNSCTMYLQETVRDETSEDGVLFNSFDCNWDTENPIVSERDMSFVKLSDIKTFF